MKMLLYKSVVLLLCLVYQTFGQSRRPNCRMTVEGGPKVNYFCQLPFFFNKKLYTGCTTDQDPDGKMWCSTKTINGNHVGNEGNWGYCDPRCKFKSTSIETTTPISRKTFTTKAPRTIQTTRSTQSAGTTRRPNIFLGGKGTSDSSRGDWLPDPESLDGECGISFVSFITNGKISIPGQFPFMALLGYTNKGTTYYLCGGVLLNRRYVLTAAHCHSTAMPIFEVVLGEWIVGQDPDCQGCGRVQRFHPKQSDLTIHPDWNRRRVQDQGNDLLLIRLDRPANTFLEDPGQQVMPICLPWKKSLGDLGEAFIAGWGKTTSNLRERGDLKTYKVFERTLQYAEVKHVPMNVCKINFTQVHSERHLCATGPPGVDSCNGDSGGPLIRRKIPEGGHNEKIMFLEGIVSYGTSRCGIGYPGVYINVEHYLPWITASMKP